VELFSKIVVPLDGSEDAERALMVAGALSKTTGAPITLVTVAVHHDQAPTAERVLRRAAVQLDQPIECEVLIGFRWRGCCSVVYIPTVARS
jgi:nucleotide-binding universal stress UspA family protein